MAITYLSGNRIQGLSTDDSATPTFTDSFSSSANWTIVGSDFSIDTANTEMDFSEISTGSDRMYHDLTSVSDTAWVLRYSNLRFSTISTYMKLNIGISGTTGASGRSNSEADCICVTLQDGGDPNDYFYVQTANSSSLAVVNGGTFSGQLSTSTDYFVEIKRTSSTSVTISIYTGSFTGTLLNTNTFTISSGITGLRYLKIFEDQADVPSGVKGIGTIQKIEFWNGVTLLNKPTDVPSGSRYEETDTRKIYYYASSAWSERS